MKVSDIILVRKKKSLLGAQVLIFFYPQTSIFGDWVVEFKYLQQFGNDHHPRQALFQAHDLLGMGSEPGNQVN